MKNRMLGLGMAMIAVAILALPAQAETFTWSATSYGSSPFRQGGIHSTSEFRQEMSGGYGEEVHEAMGLPGYYRVLVTTLLAKSSQSVQISVSNPEDFEREAVRKYRNQFVSLGDGVLGLCVQGVMPAGPYGARHDRMGFKSKGRTVVVHNVVQTFDAQYYGVILLDAASLKGVSIGTLEKCGNPTVRAFVYVRDVEKQVITQTQVIEKPVDRIVEKVVEVPVDRIVEKEVRVEVPVDRIVERVVEKEVCVNTLIFVPRRLDDVPCGKFPTPTRWISTRPGALAIGADILGSIGNFVSPFVARGTNITATGGRGGRASAAAASSSSSSATNNNRITVQNQNNNANSNTQGQGQSQGR